jgi:hypothetical protein
MMDGIASVAETAIFHRSSLIISYFVLFVPLWLNGLSLRLRAFA